VVALEVWGVVVVAVDTWIAVAFEDAVVVGVGGAVDTWIAVALVNAAVRSAGSQRSVGSESTYRGGRRGSMAWQLVSRSNLAAGSSCFAGETALRRLSSASGIRHSSYGAFYRASSTSLQRKAP
jgi:hypothetical protein